MSDRGITEIILAFEDAPALPELIRAMNAALPALADEYEIIIVDDGSTDGTASLVGSLRPEIPRLRLIRHEKNCGVGAAFRSGVLAARFDVIGYTDGDAQYSLSDLPRMFAALSSADAVSGVRARRADPFHRTIVSRCYNFLLRLVYGLPLHDTNSGLKLYRREFLDSAMPLRSDGPFFDAEVMIKGVHAGKRVVETDVQHLRRRHGQARGANLSSISRALYELSSPEMSAYVRPGLVARAVHRVVALLATSMARNRWPRAATSSPTSISRADI
jgi:glycosyltransferase involved in cell wall biosynthesis